MAGKCQACALIAMVYRLISLTRGSHPKEYTRLTFRGRFCLHACRLLYCLDKSCTSGGKSSESIVCPKGLEKMLAGVKTALHGLGSPHWEVRNSASLCFSALSVRLLGFKNQQMTSSVSSSQLFLQYPPLHATLLEHLQRAVQQLEAGTLSLHPVLLPILALLSRLRYLAGLQ